MCITKTTTKQRLQVEGNSFVGTSKVKEELLIEDEEFGETFDQFKEENLGSMSLEIQGK